MQTNSAVEQNKNIKWSDEKSESPWNQSGINAAIMDRAHRIFHHRRYYY